MNKKYLQFFLILFMGLLLIVPVVFAQGDIESEVYNVGLGLQGDYEEGAGLSNLINDIYRNALILGGAAAVAVIIYGAIYLTVSGASPDKQKEGKDIITSAIWGIVLLFGAFILLNTINPQLVKLAPPGGEEAPQTPENITPEANNCIYQVPEGHYTNCQERVKVVRTDSLPIPIPKCDTVGWENCNNEWKGHEYVEIESGGSYAQALYYPSNGDPSQARCVVYDYKITEDSEAVRTELNGLKLCMGTKVEQDNQDE